MRIFLVWKSGSFVTLVSEQIQEFGSFLGTSIEGLEEKSRQRAAKNALNHYKIKKRREGQGN